MEICPRSHSRQSNSKDLNDVSGSKDSFLYNNTGVMLLDQKLPVKQKPELRVS